MNEEWRTFSDGIYEVSNLGNVRRAVDGINTHAGRAKKVSLSGNGYLIFGHCVNGKRKNILVHRAVAEAFLGPCPSGMQVNHKDGNKTNNRVDNLEYVTVSGNAKHAIKMGLASAPTERARGERHWTHLHPDLVARGERNGASTKPECTLRGSECPSSKLTEADVRRIRHLHNTCASQMDIANQFGISRRNVNQIINYKSWRHVE